MKLWEGNVFTPVCNSFILFIGEGVSQHAMGRDVCIPTYNGGYWPLVLGGVHLWADTNSLGRHSLLGRHPLLGRPPWETSHWVDISQHPRQSLKWALSILLVCILVYKINCDSMDYSDINYELRQFLFCSSKNINGV